jgi:hypothetical protein
VNTSLTHCNADVSATPLAIRVVMIPEYITRAYVDSISLGSTSVIAGSCAVASTNGMISGRST